MGIVVGVSTRRGERTGLALAVIALAAAAPAQTDWRSSAVPPLPAPREDHAMAADLARDEVVLFGGRAADGSLSADTWVWDGTRWSNRAATGPAPRRAAALAFHPATDRVVLFGGYDPSGAPLGDTWEWDGGTWTRRTLSGGPTPRGAVAMAADSGSGDVVMFGGVDSAGTVSAETWTWDGTGWSRATTSAVPPARFGHRMATDRASSGVVMYGGVGGGDATWVFAAGAWTEHVSANPPGARLRHAMASDPARARVVLHGGTDAVAFALADTWEWDGATWIVRTPGNPPPARVDAALAFDPVSGRALLSGGFDGVSVRDDAWSYGAVFPAAVQGFGSGCPGSGGVPTIGSAATLPWIGGPFVVEVTDLPSSGAALINAGVSDAWWGGLSLPFALDPLGMPGCSIYTSIDASASVSIRGGTARLNLPIPLDANLLGGRVYVQALALDRAANAFGAITSDALAVTIGGR